MKKLKLDLDEINVETFTVTGSDRDDAGTVKAHSGGGYGCTDAYCTWYCNQSAEIACPTATCFVGCTEGCTRGPSWDYTCPLTCDWGGGCESGQLTCPN